LSTPPSSPAPERSDVLLARFWPALAAPFATELGSVVALAASAVPGIGTALVVLTVLELLMPRLRPPDAAVRLAIVIGGPPLRYLLLLAATWKVWVSPDGGPIMALLLILGLAFIVPLAAFLIVQSRARRDDR
jgi:hypothetical protein